MSPEELLQKLIDEYPAIQFKAASHGFVMIKGAHRIAFPYAVFGDPNWGVVIANHATLLETAPQPEWAQHFQVEEDDWDIGQITDRQET